MNHLAPAPAPPQRQLPDETIPRSRFCIRSAGNWFPLVDMRGKFWVSIHGWPWAYLWRDGTVQVGTGGHNDGWYDTPDQAAGAIELYYALRGGDADPGPSPVAQPCGDVRDGCRPPDESAGDEFNDADLCQCSGRGLRDCHGNPLQSQTRYLLARGTQRPVMIETFEDELNCDLWFRLVGNGDSRPQRIDELAADVQLTPAGDD